ncbi:hypothetical protein [Methanoplanus endosymbiosus]|uniref:DUF3821 domain-containing protein n=1 Tax=Methanoplanus endosymbiosus TaxID=33865 RepID=A0A9E7PLZ2_9EURY|nr:hypothetical protein [Methanoplanus endosymbiosus]UUX91286.1 hypothetical protein L6E24_07815 [Methanoplanus endosymbiosus]
MNKYRIFVILSSALFLLPVLITGVVSGSDPADDLLSYAKGDTVTVSGFAAGSPSQGVAVWLFGNNLWDRNMISVGSSGDYSYELSPSETSSLAAGQYYVIVQHPGYNGKFDVYTSTDAQGQTIVTSDAGSSFIIGGSGSLQGRQAAAALMGMLDSNDIDDMYSYTSFILKDPLIEDNSDDKVYEKGVISLSGSTNFAAGEKLFYSLQPLEFGPTSKDSDMPEGGTSGNIYVTGSHPLNLWNVEIDASDYPAGEYMFEIGRPDGSYKTTMTITITEVMEKSPAGNEKTATSVQTPVQTSVAAETEAITPMGQKTPQSPFSVVVPVLAAALSLLWMGCGRRVL